MLRPLVFACIAAAVTLPAAAADLSGTPRYGHGQVVEPAPLAGRGRYLAVESPPFDKIITYAPQAYAPEGAGPLQVHRYFGPPQVSYYYSHYGVPPELLVGRQQFGCNYRYC
ncbi:hypothetical protein AB7714_01160 [Tardiphaga sp. 1201_B9_N1_1]|uniref:hypothetical protein n=1 Tax=unclassified Tardiphaga TaxID=2631404 RepID=UPI003F24BD10